MNKLYIQCDGGFGNRFNVLCFGLYLSKILNYSPVIIWPSNNWCGASFFDLFEKESLQFCERSSINLDNTINIVHENQFELKTFININSIISIQQIQNLCQGKDIFYFNNLIPWRLISEFDSFKNTIRDIKFKKEIVDTAERIIFENCQTHLFFGIHIRKTDFGDRSDSVEPQLMNIVQQNCEHKFFVCSDDEITENKFLQNKNVFKYEKQDYVKKLLDGSWNSTIVDSNKNSFAFNVDRSKQSVVDAVVDLLILSKSTIISPDVGSTFMHTAKLLKDCY